MENEVEQHKIPTAVSVKPVLALIRAHTEGDKQAAMKAALEIARELELNNEEELALYILAQFQLVPTFVPM